MMNFENYEVSHIIGGLFLAIPGLLLSLRFRKTGLLLSILVPLIFATVREVGQNLQWWGPHHIQSYEQIIHDIGHHMLGASVVAMTIGLVILFL